MSRRARPISTLPSSGRMWFPTDSSLLSGLNATIMKCHGWNRRSKPTVTFTLTNKAGNGVPISGAWFAVADHGGADHRLRLHDFRQRHDLDAGLCDGKRDQQPPAPPAAPALTPSRTRFPPEPPELTPSGSKPAARRPFLRASRTSRASNMARRILSVISRWMDRRSRRGERSWSLSNCNQCHVSSFACTERCATTWYIA